MNFKFNPRQIFIRQANAERTIEYGIEGIQFYNDKLKSEDSSEKSLLLIQVAVVECTI